MKTEHQDMKVEILRADPNPDPEYAWDITIRNNITGHGSRQSFTQAQMTECGEMIEKVFVPCLIRAVNEI